MMTWELINQNSFHEGFPYDNLELARLSYVNIFQESQTP